MGVWWESDSISPGGGTRVAPLTASTVWPVAAARLLAELSWLQTTARDHNNGHPNGASQSRNRTQWSSQRRVGALHWGGVRGGLRDDR